MSVATWPATRSGNSSADGAAAPFVRAQNISKSFAAHSVLKDVSLEILPGELIAILGPSGCGKTTLLRIIAGLEKQDAGRIIIDGADVSTAPPAARRCGIVFQSYALFPNLSVASNIAFGMDRKRTTHDQRMARVTELLQLIGLPGIESKYPAKLSGGQQQRVALARALAVDPSILLLDEPLSALDAKVRTRLRTEIRQIQQRLGVTTLLVTHDQEEALTMADRVVVMDHGRILQIGTPWQIYRNPSHLLVSDFVGSINLLSGWISDGSARLKLDTITLAHDRAPIAKGISSSVAFRPEEAQLLDVSESDQKSNCIPAQVVRVEFRGAFCRVHVLSMDRPLVVDAPFEKVQRFIHAPDANVLLHIPPQHVQVFREDGTVVRHAV